MLINSTACATFIPREKQITQISYLWPATNKYNGIVELTASIQIPCFRKDIIFSVLKFSGITKEYEQAFRQNDAQRTQTAVIQTSITSTEFEQMESIKCPSHILQYMENHVFFIPFALYSSRHRLHQKDKSLKTHFHLMTAVTSYLQGRSTKSWRTITYKIATQNGQRLIVRIKNKNSMTNSKVRSLSRF